MTIFYFCLCWFCWQCMYAHMVRHKKSDTIYWGSLVWTHHWASCQAVAEEIHVVLDLHVDLCVQPLTTWDVWNTQKTWQFHDVSVSSLWSHCHSDLANQSTFQRLMVSNRNLVIDSSDWQQFFLFSLPETSLLSPVVWSHGDWRYIKNKEWWGVIWPVTLILKTHCFLLTAMPSCAFIMSKTMGLKTFRLGNHPLHDWVWLKYIPWDSGIKGFKTSKYNSTAAEKWDRTPAPINEKQLTALLGVRGYQEKWSLAHTHTHTHICIHTHCSSTWQKC